MGIRKVYLRISLIFTIHFKLFQNSAGQQQASAICWGQTPSKNHYQECKLDTIWPYAHACSTKSSRREEKNKRQTSCVISQTSFQPIARQLVRICWSKHHITSNASWYYLGSDIFIGLITRVKVQTPTNLRWIKLNVSLIHSPNQSPNSPFCRLQ